MVPVPAREPPFRLPPFPEKNSKNAHIQFFNTPVGKTEARFLHAKSFYLLEMGLGFLTVKDKLLSFYHYWSGLYDRSLICGETVRSLV